MFVGKSIFCSIALVKLSVLVVSALSLRPTDALSSWPKVFGECGLSRYDITNETIKKFGLDRNNVKQMNKFRQTHLPAAYRYDWLDKSEAVGLRQARPAALSEPVVIRLKVLYDETLLAHHRDRATLLRYLRNLLLDVQMIFWQPELFNTIKIYLVVVELAQLDRKIDILDTMERLLMGIHTYNKRADNSINYYDLVMVFVYRTIYDFRPDGSILPALGVSNPYTFCNQKSNAYGSRGIVVQTAHAAAPTTAHELGHTLGLMHDGLEPNVFIGTPSCDPKNHIMAAFSELGQTTWSTCSVQAMLLYLRSPQVFECVFNPNRISDAIPVNEQFDWRNARVRPVIAPGKETSLEEQCDMNVGESAPPKKEASAWVDASQNARFFSSCEALICQAHDRLIYVGPALAGSTCLSHPDKLAGTCLNGSCTTSNSSISQNSSLTLNS